jgi:SAM-dependent methyltransferase
MSGVAPLLDLSAAPLVEILAHVQARLAAGDEEIAFAALDPDAGAGRYAGEAVSAEELAALAAASEDGELAGGLHRPWRVWIELADRLGLRLCTPRLLGGGRVRVALRRLGAARWQDEAAAGAATNAASVTERYGAASGYARIHKAEEPGFVLDLALAVARCRLPAAPRILDLGVNDGDELALLMALHPALAAARFVGVDHSASALAVAASRLASLPAEQVRLVLADLNSLGDGDPLGLGRFDLVISLGTLQSPGVDDRALLRRVVQDHLAPAGAVILGVPNCRYQDGELVHGARMKNFREPELGLVIKDVAFYRKYLQQHHRQVFVTGHHTLLVTGVAGG